MSQLVAAQLLILSRLRQEVPYVVLNLILWINYHQLRL